jgi:Holliday junction DNA helicase RuvA
MFDYIKGTLVAATPAQATVEVQGVGYAIFIPCHTFGRLPQLGEKLQLHTLFIVREFSHALYGFLTVDERDLFGVLMNVSGIGPKLALSLIGHLSLDGLQGAIANCDLPSLCKVPGVGKKTAERLIVELKDKVAHMGWSAPSMKGPQTKPTRLQFVHDAVQALVNLGYSQNVAQKAIQKSLKDLPESVDLATLITTGLRNV